MKLVTPLVLKVCTALALMTSLKVRASRMAEGKKLVSQFLAPLLPQIGRHDHQDTAASFGPTLDDQEPRLDGLAQTHFVGQNRPPGEWITKRKQGCFDLVRVEIDLGVGENRRQPFDAVGCTTPRQFVGDVFRVIRRELHGVTSTGC